MSSKSTANATVQDGALFERTMSWLQSLRVTDKPFGHFKMSASTDDTIFTSCFAAFLYDLLNEVDNLTEKEREEWLDFILSHQDEKTGLFHDSFSDERNLSAAHNLRYVTWQLTTFCISAVYALKGELRYPLAFIDDENLNQPEIVRSTLEEFNWNNPWGAGNLAMFLGIMLMEDSKQKGLGMETASIKAFFDWHDDYQNKKTGFWGEGRNSEYHNGLFGAYHQYLLYFYANRKLNCKKEIIDRIISFQNIDGMFAPQMGGGGCEDIDAIDTLVQLSIRTDYRASDIKKVLLKSYNAITALESEKGGFIWGVRKRYGPYMFLRNLFSFVRNREFYQWVFVNRRFVREQINPLKPRHPEG
ncbi:MAG: hypothetical protein KAU21_14100 [Gammaproteobacteria bacterium]|nr:hypothetical protein [Gammaproteobacteria bacterium]